MTAQELEEAIKSATVGQSITYYTGDLALARAMGCRVAEGIALAAQAFHERGDVRLFQKRLAPNSYRYIAIRVGR
jgi:hypothetical protein